LVGGFSQCRRQGIIVPEVSTKEQVRKLTKALRSPPQEDAALENFVAAHFASRGAYVETADASIQQPLHGTVATWMPGPIATTR